MTLITPSHKPTPRPSFDCEREQTYPLGSTTDTMDGGLKEQVSEQDERMRNNKASVGNEDLLIGSV
jgi:hypothetical protein